MIIIDQICPRNCRCSFCHESAWYYDHDGAPTTIHTKMHYGLNIPRAWRDGWWTVKYWPHRYLRIAWRWAWPWRWSIYRSESPVRYTGS